MKCWVTVAFGPNGGHGQSVLIANPMANPWSLETESENVKLMGFLRIIVQDLKTTLKNVTYLLAMQSIRLTHNA